jgi:hypothetical protein
MKTVSMDWDEYVKEAQAQYQNGMNSGAEYCMRHSLSDKDLPEDLKALKEKIESEVKS